MIAKIRAEDLEHARVRGRWLPIAAISFVLFALVVLTVVPARLSGWINALHREAETQVLPARIHTAELALTAEEQVAAVRAYQLSNDEAYRRRFESARARQLTALGRVRAVTPALGATARSHVDAVAVLVDSIHAIHADVLYRGTAREEYLALLPTLEAHLDSVRLHVDGIQAEITRAGEQQLQSADRAIRLQRAISIALGLLAVLAALVVGWLARRQWYLTRTAEATLVEEHRLRRESDEAREALTRVTESRARLLRGFGHDVKNPLGAADGYLQLLAEGVLGPLTERQLAAIRNANRSIHGALNLVDDLVELARAETGNLEIAHAPTDLREVAREAADEYRAQAEAKKLNLELDLPDEFPFVATDRRRVRQVLGNLISNAVKYTREGSITIRLRVLGGDRTSSTARRVAIEVSDTGSGIPAEQQQILFEEFVRLEPTVGQGVGLGLAISSRLARALGGEITVESEVGRGSTFTLTLPLRRSTDLRAA